MTGPRSHPKDADDTEKRLLDQALEEGLEERQIIPPVLAGNRR